MEYGYLNFIHFDNDSVVDGDSAYSGVFVFVDVLQGNLKCTTDYTTEVMLDSW